ncbi:MAG: CpsD/CapB family tyrosine-protein kinase, partial [Planctomycetota bacterium]
MLTTLAERSNLAAQDAQEIDAEIKSREPAYEALKQRDLDLEIVQSRISRVESDIDMLQERIRAITINDTQTDDSTIDILNHASADNLAVARSKSQTFAIFVLGGLAAGAAIAFVLGTMDQRIRNVQAAVAATQLPVLAIMPRTRSRKRDEPGQALSLWENERKFSEAARSLRTAVYFGSVDRSIKVLQVTSPDPSEGKSSITSCLALAMASSGQRTLLIDADLRRPRQHKLFDLENDVGLSSVLAKQVSLAAAIRTSVRENFDILSTGPTPPNPAEMLNSRAMIDLLAQVAGDYDQVLVDSPPVLPVTDARIIAAKCEGTVLVLRVDRTSRKRASLARDDLRSVGARLLGTCLNDMPSGIGYGYGYGY